MRRSFTATVHSTCAANGGVKVMIDNGFSFEVRDAWEAPKVHDLIRMDLVWGDDFNAPAVPIREADPALEALLRKEDRIARRGSWRGSLG